MRKSQLTFFSAALVSLLMLPSALNPISADTQIGPIPIPPNLLPPIVPGTTTTIVPILPNLGTVSTSLPQVQLYSINKVSSGLITSDSLTNETRTQQQLEANPGYWKYYGDAILENATYAFSRDTQGLHIGVQSPSTGPYAGQYAGFYAESPNTNGMLYHAILSVPKSMISNTTNPQWFNNGLYVQRSSLPVNYASCFADVGAWGVQWAVGYVTGDANQATTFHVPWYDTSANQPLTRDCTIITNGNNYLKAYLDGNLVYEADNLTLQMPAPFNAYLEPQTTDTNEFLTGTYQNYYATTSEYVKVVNNPSLATTVDLVDSTGKVLATSPVDSSGTATLEVGELDMPVDAYIKVYGTDGVQLASTQTPINIFGGDQYSVSLLGLGGL